MLMDSSQCPNQPFRIIFEWSIHLCFLAQPHLDMQENMSHLYNSQKNGFKTTYESHII